jgi:hypothetical protein
MYVILGATGHIGSALSQRLLERGESVRATTTLEQLRTRACRKSPRRTQGRRHGDATCITSVGMKDTTGIHTTCLAILSTLLVTPLANAQSTPAPPLRHFGERGELVLSSDGYVAIDVYADGAPTTYVTLDLAADYFITDGLSVGGMVVLDHTDRNGPGNSTVGVGARIGYNFVVSDRFSIWPRLRAVFRHYVADPWSSARRACTTIAWGFSYMRRCCSTRCRTFSSAWARISVWAEKPKSRSDCATHSAAGCSDCAKRRCFSRT